MNFFSFFKRKQNPAKDTGYALANSATNKAAIAAALAQELADNRLKGEMFMTIYAEKLNELRNFDRRAGYEDTSDFIHQRPPLSRNAYDAHSADITLLGPRLADQITKIYANINPVQEYITLDSTMPRAQALDIIENVLEKAEKLLAPMESVIAGLNVIIRDSEKQGM